LIYDFIHNGKMCQIDIESRNGKTTAAVDGRKYEIEIEKIAPHLLLLIINNQSYKVTYAKDGHDLFVYIKGEIFKFQIPGDDEDILEIKDAIKGNQDLLIKSSMPGSVLKIEVKEGDTVEEGQCLIIVEAMKMETGLNSTIAGKVKKICTEPGKQINSGEVLIELEKNQ